MALLGLFFLSEYLCDGVVRLGEPPDRLTQGMFLDVKVIKINKLVIICAAGCAAANLAGCGKSAGPEAPPPPQVSVAQVLEKRVKDWDEFTGRLQAVETVEIRPRVSGYIDKGAFTEGSVATGAPPS